MSELPRQPLPPSFLARTIASTEAHNRWIIEDAAWRARRAELRLDAERDVRSALLPDVRSALLPDEVAKSRMMFSRQKAAALVANDSGNAGWSAAATNAPNLEDGVNATRSALPRRQGRRHSRSLSSSTNSQSSSPSSRSCSRSRGKDRRRKHHSRQLHDEKHRRHHRRRRRHHNDDDHQGSGGGPQNASLPIRTSPSHSDARSASREFSKGTVSSSNTM